MQPLARDGLTTERVTELLRSPVLTVQSGLELLRPDLSVQEDISEDLVGGKVSRNCDATIHGTCQLQITRALRWGVDLVRPFMILSDGRAEVRFDCGVYVLTTPELVSGTDVPTYDCDGYDRIVLLQRQVGQERAYYSGLNYLDVLTGVLADAGMAGTADIDRSAADYTLPSTLFYPLVPKRYGPGINEEETTSPVTWLRILNDLLAAINFRAVYAEASGRLRMQRYQPAQSRTVDFDFDVDDPQTIVGEQRTFTQDLWDAPNRWVFYQSNRADTAPPSSEGEGQWTYELSPEHPLRSGRLTWSSAIAVEAASQQALEDIGRRIASNDINVTATIKTTTGPFPAAGHYDTFTLRDELGARRVEGNEWTYDLDGSDVSWLWRVVPA